MMEDVVVFVELYDVVGVVQFYQFLVGFGCQSGGVGNCVQFFVDSVDMYLQKVDVGIVEDGKFSEQSVFWDGGIGVEDQKEFVVCFFQIQVQIVCFEIFGF